MHRLPFEMQVLKYLFTKTRDYDSKLEIYVDCLNTDLEKQAIANYLFNVNIMNPETGEYFIKYLGLTSDIEDEIKKKQEERKKYRLQNMFRFGKPTSPYTYSYRRRR